MSKRPKGRSFDLEAVGGMSQIRALLIERGYGRPELLPDGLERFIPDAVWRRLSWLAGIDTNLQSTSQQLAKMPFAGHYRRIVEDELHPMLGLSDRSSSRPFEMGPEAAWQDQCCMVWYALLAMKLDYRLAGSVRDILAIILKGFVPDLQVGEPFEGILTHQVAFVRAKDESGTPRGRGGPRLVNKQYVLDPSYPQFTNSLHHQTILKQLRARDGIIPLPPSFDIFDPDAARRYSREAYGGTWQPVLSWALPNDIGSIGRGLVRC